MGSLLAAIAPIAAVALLLGCAARPEPEDAAADALAAAPVVDDRREPCAERHPQRTALFGALHVHTAFSFDAWSWDVRNGPSEAFAFARGEPVRLPPLDADGRGTRTVQLEVPLDFAALTDHSELMGETRLCSRPGSPAYESALCRRYRGESRWFRFLGLFLGELAPYLRLMGFLPSLEGVPATHSESVCGEGGARCRAVTSQVWREVQLAAEAAYDRSSACRFTSFVAYEYSALPRGNNLHRNVIFRNAAVPALPTSYVDAGTPEALWRRLRADCLDAGRGCDVLAIPHNSNWSGGQMFVAEYPGAANEAEQALQARTRSGMEPLVEVFQHKGDSECRNLLPGVAGPPDELCDFEKLRPPREPQEDCGTGYDADGGGNRLLSCISHRDYARYAVVEGLREEARIGANPFKLGFVAATDTHNGTGGMVRERGFPGNFGLGDASLRGRLSAMSRRYNPGGLAGVFAEENSRDAVFAALRRRETFGTSGPRIVPRLFGGWRYPESLCARGDLLAEGYAGGVPMGGDLPPRPADARAPRFLVSALRDPRGALLQRVQIVKGWVGDDGRVAQAIYDVVGSARSGATVDPDSCEPRGPGLASACSVWSDPDFDPARRAVYYARVVENPTCRYQAWECNALPPGERPDACDAMPREIQERAWTSPIWYTPAG